MIAPVLDLGFDASTFVTRRVRDLVPGGPAERAGLREGDAVELPGYFDALALGPDDVLDVGVIRDGRTTRLTLPLDEQTTAIPQWRKKEVCGVAEREQGGGSVRVGTLDGSDLDRRV